MAIPKVRIKDAVELIKLSMRAKKPVMVVGAPGIGKSDVMNQVRLAMGMDLILSHPVVSDPTDAKGMPYCTTVNGKPQADFIPYGDLRFAMETNRPTLWFLDDLGQAPPSVQASYMQLLLAREINGKRISDNITFAAATNGRQHKAGVTGILEPVKGRFGMIFELISHIDDSCEWMYKNGIYPVIPAYLRFDPKQLHNFSPNNDMEQSPCPRTWKALSDLLLEMGDTLPQLRQAVVAATVGEGASTTFCTFEKMYGKLPDIDMLLKYPDTFVPPREPDVMYAIASSIATRTTLNTIDNIVLIAQRMPKQYAALMMHDARSVCPDIDLTEAYGRYSEALAGAYIN